MPDPAVTNLPTSNASLLPSAMPTILSSAVAQALAVTPQSPMLVQAPQPLAIGIQRTPAPAPSKLPWILSGAGLLGLGVVACLVLRKKGRK